MSFILKWAILWPQAFSLVYLTIPFSYAETQPTPTFSGTVSSAMPVFQRNDKNDAYAVQTDRIIAIAHAALELSNAEKNLAEAGHTRMETQALQTRINYLKGILSVWAKDVQVMNRVRFHTEQEVQAIRSDEAAIDLARSKGILYSSWDDNIRIDAIHSIPNHINDNLAVRSASNHTLLLLGEDPAFKDAIKIIDGPPKMAVILPFTKDVDGNRVTGLSPSMFVMPPMKKVDMEDAELFSNYFAKVDESKDPDLKKIAAKNPKKFTNRSEEIKAEADDLLKKAFEKRRNGPRKVNQKMLDQNPSLKVTFLQRTRRLYDSYTSVLFEPDTEPMKFDVNGNSMKNLKYLPEFHGGDLVTLLGYMKTNHLNAVQDSLAHRLLSQGLAELKSTAEEAIEHRNEKFNIFKTTTMDPIIHHHPDLNPAIPAVGVKPPGTH